MKYELRALTDIWTGGMDRTANNLHLSGLKGALRWWYEALVRGLGYFACDPTSNGCRLDPKKLKKYTSTMNLIKTIKGEICPACYLFGCTGWGGQTALRVWIKQGDGSKRIALDALKANVSFILEFLQKKKMEPVEEALITALIKLISNYGALGGKTIFKPSEIESKNNKLHHRNFGVIAMVNNDLQENKICKTSINEYFEGFKRREERDPEWPDLSKFWFVGGKYLTRLEHNKIVGRNERGEYINLSGVNARSDLFMGGFIARDKSRFDEHLKENYKGLNAASKKIFSFHGRDPIERCFGYVAYDMDVDTFISEIINKLPHKFTPDDFIRGSKILSTLREN